MKESNLDEHHKQKTCDIYLWQTERGRWSKEASKLRAFTYGENQFLFTPLCLCISKYNTRNMIKKKFQDEYFDLIVKEMNLPPNKKIFYKDAIHFFNATIDPNSKSKGSSSPSKSEFLAMVRFFAEKKRKL